MARNYYETPDIDDIFERDEADRRRAMVAEVVEANKKRQEREDQQAAVRRENARQFALRVNGDQLCSEYRAAGVEPLQVNGDGVPTVSLSLMISLGWTIIDVSGERKLVEPPTEPTRRARSREDYSGEGS